MKTFIAILLMLVSSVAHAEAPITGAFGMTLGDVVDESLTLIREHSVDWPFRDYAFEPEAASNIFTSFVVRTTPVKRLIYSIIVGNENGECMHQFRAIKKVLAEKYGKPIDERELPGKGTSRWQSHEHNHRTIMLFCGGSTKWPLSLSYTDNTIYELVWPELELDATAKAKAEADAKAEAGNL